MERYKEYLSKNNLLIAFLQFFSFIHPQGPPQSSFHDTDKDIDEIVQHIYKLLPHPYHG